MQKADITWALTIGQKDFSNNSAKDVSEAYKTTFPDCQIASSFQCGDKIKYLTNWGYRSVYKESVSTRNE